MSADELQEFVTESKDLIADAERALLALESGAPFGSQYDAIFRAFHSIKGMASMLDLTALQSHVHQLESLLVPFKDARLLPKNHVDLFLRGCDVTLKLLDGQQVAFDYNLAAEAPAETAEAAVPAVAIPSATPEGDPAATSGPPPAAAAAPSPTQAADADAWKKIAELVARAQASDPPQSAVPLDNDAIDFLGECEEMAQRCCGILLRIERGEPVEADFADTLYRDVHTIKGGAMLFGMQRLAEAANAVESAMEPVRRNRVALRPEEIDLLLRSITLLQNFVVGMRQSPLPSQAAAVAPTPAPPPPAQSPMHAPPPMAAPAPAAAAPAPSAPVHAPPPAKVEPAHGGEAPRPSEGMEPSSSVRVPVALLDRLMATMGEMVLVRNQVLQFASKSDDFEFLRLSQRLDVVTSEIQGEVMKTRMQPIGNVLDKFQRIVRDLSKTLEKRIDLQLIGTETELDKTLLEAVKDPLMHVVRNCCDHGIEPTAERRTLGKSDAGKVVIRAYQEGGQVVIDVSDDGRGLNRDKLLKKAIEKNLVDATRAFGLSDREVFAFIFAPGFSTAAQVTNVSGRGVGMDVVRSNIEKIGGLVELESRLGHGMTLRMKIPLTLAILPAMIIRSAEERYAIPQLKVVELLRLENNAVHGNRLDMLQGKPFFRQRGNLLPLLSLREVLGQPTEPATLLLERGEAINIVVVRSEKIMFGIMVDEVQDKADIVVKPLSSFLKSVNSYCGATVLGDGAIALILDINGIAARHALQMGAADAALQDTRPKEKADAQELLLFQLDGRKERFAVPLPLVYRLEELRRSQIELSGEQEVIRYRGGLLPVVCLRTSLGLQNLSTADTTPNALLKLIVVRKHSSFYGMWVHEILDVITTSAAMDDGPTDRPSILGNIITEAGIISVVDIFRIIDALEAKMGVPQAAPEVPVSAAGAPRILFAEDTTFFRKHVCSVLEKAGYRVDTAVDGRAALDKLTQAPPQTYQLLLSDVEMPQLNGLQLVAQVRAHPQFKSLPSVALTTRYAPEHVAEGRAAGFDAYLEKMNAEVLLQTLQQLLGPGASSHQGAA